MRSYDVLIVGGGPAGSTLAYSLKDSGLTIGILDKQSFPRQKICAGWVTPEVMRVLKSSPVIRRASGNWYLP